MSAPPTRRLRFRWSWRPHQRRVLRTIGDHLHDDRLHLVAAPGAGKTTLGLEVFRRLERPTLVLAPTLTIRDQWVRRLEDFLPAGATDTDREWLRSWTSSDLDSFAFLTAATYQTVLSRSRARVRGPADEDGASRAPSVEEVDGLVARMRQADVGMLILDEAHHLKREWWRALESVVSALDGVTLLSLTATPPYDATGREWQRYEELCGPIDDEISVPELVKAGTLCPHQDFVYAVAPSREVAAGVEAHDLAVNELLTDLIQDPRFQGEIDSHPWVVSPTADVSAVLERPDLAVALLAYLRATGAALPPHLIGVLELGPGQLPSLDRRWWSVLLEGYVLGTTFDADEGYRQWLTKRLRSDGLLWRRELRLVRSGPVERSLALSNSKTVACVDIHRREREARGLGLRQVVLTDFIRDEGLGGEPAGEPSDLGALPVFDALALLPERHRDMALVSGRLSVVHESRGDALRAALSGADVRLSRLPHREGWMRVDGIATGRLVGALTALLARGELRVIVGTRSLLGEGWDAPVVNSLVLASYVGAFVSTNQMRGRAIRTDAADAAKVSSVWHIVAVEPEVPTGVLDLEQLRRRFKTFVGLSASGTSIESGLDRLELPKLHSRSDLDAFNRVSLARLNDLTGIGAAWSRAIASGDVGQVVPSVGFARAPTLRTLHLRNTLRAVFLQAGFALVVAGGEVLRSTFSGDLRSLGAALIVAGAGPFLALTPRLFRIARLALLHAPVAGSVTQIGRALLDALREVGALEHEDLSVRVGRLADGTVHVSLVGGSFYDQSVFADAMADLLGPVENPRYLITRPATKLLRARIDYHPVPIVLGTHRDRADALLRAWRRHVGPGELVYTRREGGRSALLAARARSFANQFVPSAERLDRWH